DGQLNASLGAALGLDWRGAATLHSDGDPGKLALQHTLTLGDRGVHTTLRASDATGPVLALDAALELPLERLQLLSLVQRARSLALTQPWSLTLDAPARDLQSFPLRSLITSEAPPALKVGLHIAAEHASQAEP